MIYEYSKIQSYFYSVVGRLPAMLDNKGYPLRERYSMSPYISTSFGAF
jgi:hypothetical protein